MIILETPLSHSTLDLVKIFESCPIIYTLLLILSVGASIIWLYTFLTLRLSDLMPKNFLLESRKLILERKYEELLKKCHNESNFSSQVIAAGISGRSHGHEVMMTLMQSEGKRLGSSIWQRIFILNEIAVIAPMLGLLGTVLGLFFAFYDLNRTEESIANLFDGLGIAIGTTVVGLVVALLSMFFYTTLKFRVIKILQEIENQSLLLISLVNDR